MIVAYVVFHVASLFVTLFITLVISALNETKLTVTSFDALLSVLLQVSLSEKIILSLLTYKSPVATISPVTFISPVTLAPASKLI